MSLRIAAALALAIFVVSQFLPVMSAKHNVVAGWQLTWDQVRSTFQVFEMVVRHPAVLTQTAIDARNGHALAFMFGVTSATAGMLTATCLGMFRRTWPCLIFAMSATTSAAITALQFFELTRAHPFQIESGAWLWLGSMCGLVVTAGWTVGSDRRRRDRRGDSRHPSDEQPEVAA